MTDQRKLTDERIVEIRDQFLPNQGEPFDCIAFARGIEAELSARQAQPRIDPLQDPLRPAHFMNYVEDETPAEMVLRKLACWLGVGGYNAPKVDADLFHRKIVAGVEMLLEGAKQCSTSNSTEKKQGTR